LEDEAESGSRMGGRQYLRAAALKQKRGETNVS
jgi:hypothetical protein